MPRLLYDKLEGATTVAPSTDNEYTFGPGLGEAAFTKGQNMLREVAGNDAVIAMHQIMEAMAGYGNEKSVTAENLLRQATRAQLMELRDHLVEKFPLPNANNNAMDVSQDSTQSD